MKLTPQQIKDAIAYNLKNKHPTNEEIAELVAYFQAAQKLTVDGMFGPVSQKALETSLIAHTASVSVTTPPVDADITVVVSPPSIIEVEGLPTGHSDPLLTNVHDIDHDGWLYGSNVERWPSVRNQKLATPNELPIGVMFHFTAVRPGADLWRRIQNYDRDKDRAASWHVIIEADGRIYQSVSLQRGSWHCRPVTMVEYGNTKYSPNSSLIGIELASLDGKSWPAAQITAATQFITELAEQYGMKREHCGYLHMEFDPARRNDPGPIWKNDILPKLLDTVFTKSK